MARTRDANYRRSRRQKMEDAARAFVPLPIGEPSKEQLRKEAERLTAEFRARQEQTSPDEGQAS